MIYTIGYEGATLGAFIGTLLDQKIDRVIDIRELPQSRRPGFSKRVLAAALEEAGIEYEHRKALGDPKAGRDAARAGKMDEFRSIFEAHMKTPEAQEALKETAKIVTQEVCVLLCYERQPKDCHRTIVAGYLDRATGLKVNHLGVNSSKPRGIARGDTNADRDARAFG